jgi:hypothetical protein
MDFYYINNREIMIYKIIHSIHKHIYHTYILNNNILINNFIHVLILKYQVMKQKK